MGEKKKDVGGLTAAVSGVVRAVEESATLQKKAKQIILFGFVRWVLKIPIFCGREYLVEPDVINVMKHGTARFQRITSILHWVRTNPAGSKTIGFLRLKRMKKTGMHLCD